MQYLEYEGAAPKRFLDICFIVKGELSVANFELTLLSGVHFLTLVAVHPCPVVFQGTAANCHRRAELIYWKLIDLLA
jgi:hypothetical protein